MELNQQNTQNNSILSYEKNFLTLANGKVNFPCFIDSSNFRTIDSIDFSNIKQLAIGIELLIIGSKNTYSMQEQVIIKQVVNTEFMNISASIHSFNMMLGDNRNVALVII